MRNIHLRINYGCEQRYNLIKRTVLSHYPYFKTVRIVNTGPDENEHDFDSLKQRVDNLEVFNCGGWYHMCTTEDISRSYLIGIPDGEWLAYLDSDWRFPEVFLKNMQDQLDILENEGYNHLFSYQLAHWIGEKPTDFAKQNCAYTQERIDNMLKHPDLQRYGHPLLQKVDKKNTWCDSFLGNHNYLLQVPYNNKHVCPMYHLHFRDFGPKAYCGSMTYLAWWYAGHHVFPTNDHIIIQASDEYKRHEEFKEKHGCFTSNQLHQKLKSDNPEFKENLKQLFLSFKDTKIFSFEQMYNIAAKYDMEFYQAPDEDYCPGDCCKYHGKYIGELE